MRCLKIEDCDYEYWEAIRDVIYKEIPFSLVNQGYSSKERIGIFNFWDSDYIPKELEEYILNPPKSREDIEKQIQEIKRIITKKKEETQKVMGVGKKKKS